jgi:hypothetical protein
MGYSRYASKGKGLSDRASRTARGGRRSVGSASRSISSRSSGMSGYSRYASEGKGLTDAASRAYAESLSGNARRDYTTFVSSNGSRRARGSWQVVGETAATLGYGGEGLRTAPVSHKWSGSSTTNGAYNLFEDGLVFSVTGRDYINRLIGAGSYNETTIEKKSTTDEILDIVFPNRGGGITPNQPKEIDEGGIGIIPIALIGGLAYFLLKK